LLLEADTPTINIESRHASQNFLQLPALQYGFTIAAFCVDDFIPVSLLLSVADTRKTLRAAEIDFSNAIEISLSVPASQLAPIAVRGFCLKVNAAENDTLADGQPQGKQLTLPATLSAQASLRCASDTNEQTIYVSKPLDVTVVCGQSPALPPP
jgi:hypothetical protein